MLLAVLTKRVGLLLYNHDVYANVVGGLNLDEPGVDLGIAAAVASSFKERQIAPDVAVIGEVGLSGEVRSASQVGLRVREAAKLGFRRCILPKAGTLLDRERVLHLAHADQLPGEQRATADEARAASKKAGGKTPVAASQDIELIQVNTLAQALEAALD
jgi:predicted ATP-dependent serine protease